MSRTLIAQSSNKCRKNVKCSWFGCPYYKNNVTPEAVGLILCEAEMLTDLESRKECFGQYYGKDGHNMVSIIAIPKFVISQLEAMSAILITCD